jgi:septum formation protein
MERPLILASGSPRRKKLLEIIGITIEAVPSAIEEMIRKDESPETYVLRMAREKTEDVASRFCDRWVIGADTSVVLDGEILGKPETAMEARGMLTRLSGRNHWVFTGYAIAKRQEAAFVSEVVETRVRVKHLSPGEINWYVGTGEPFGKAGAYAIQGVGCFMIKGIEGSYTNVVGLPVCEVLESLCALGAIDRK